jgi:uncharacterized protein (DUF2164 family)
MSNDAMKIKLSDERRAAIRKALIDLFQEDFDQELSDFRAGEVLQFFVRSLGPAVYNQAISDARGFMLEKLDDLDAEFYVEDPSDERG